jgi:hypothetical protein
VQILQCINSGKDIVLREISESGEDSSYSSNNKVFLGALTKKAEILQFCKKSCSLKSLFIRKQLSTDPCYIRDMSKAQVIMFPDEFQTLYDADLCVLLISAPHITPN